MKKWMSRFWLACSIPCGLNLIFLWSQRTGYIFVMLLLTLLLSGNLLRIIFLPIRDKAGTGLRVRIMMGGRRLVYCGLYAMAAQAMVFYFIYLKKHMVHDPGLGILASNAVFACIGCFLLLAAGVLRIFFTSRRLSILRRVIMVLVMWIPVVNLIVLLYACRLVYEEYDFEREKAQLRVLRIDSEICRTKYPLVMVHGIGFRDLRYFNYWGRIPRELMRNGAVVYYGNQEALGTIVYNAEDIRKKIFQVLSKTGVKKLILLHIPKVVWMPDTPSPNWKWNLMWPH